MLEQQGFFWKPVLTQPAKSPIKRNGETERHKRAQKCSEIDAVVFVFFLTEFVV